MQNDLPEARDMFYIRQLELPGRGKVGVRGAPLHFSHLLLRYKFLLPAQRFVEAIHVVLQ